MVELRGIEPPDNDERSEIPVGTDPPLFKAPGSTANPGLLGLIINAEWWS